MLAIPNRFSIGGRAIEVTFNENLSRDHEAVGLTHFKNGTIELQPSVEWYEQADDHIQHTFCHELVHCLLFAISENELARDEKLVDRLGMVLHQALSTFEYDEIEEDDEECDHGCA